MFERTEEDLKCLDAKERQRYDRALATYQRDQRREARERERASKEWVANHSGHALAIRLGKRLCKSADCRQIMTPADTDPRLCQMCKVVSCG